jgi:hypothetical protein
LWSTVGSNTTWFFLGSFGRSPLRQSEGQGSGWSPTEKLEQHTTTTWQKISKDLHGDQRVTPKCQPVFDLRDPRLQSQ